MIVDSHIHLWDVRNMPGPLSYEPPLKHASADLLIEEMATCGVDRAILVQPQLHGDNHELLMSAIEQQPDRFVGFGLVDIATTDKSEIPCRVDAIADLGLVGLRIHLNPSTIEVASAVVASAVDCGLAIELHVNSDSWPQVLRIVDQAGDVTVVVDHLGRPGRPYGAAAARFFGELGRRPNAVMKVSAFDVLSAEPPPHPDLAPLAASAVESLGPDRLLWGSNFPWSRGADYRATVDSVHSLFGPLGTDVEKILGGNARRLFFGGAK